MYFLLNSCNGTQHTNIISGSSGLGLLYIHLGKIWMNSCLVTGDNNPTVQRQIERVSFVHRTVKRDQNRNCPTCQEPVHQRHWPLKSQLCIGSHKTHPYFITYINLHSQYIINECIEFWWSGGRQDMEKPNLQVFISFPNKTLQYFSYSTMQCCSQSDKLCALMSYTNGLFSISNSIKQFHKRIMWIYIEWHSVQISWQFRERD